MKITDVLLEAMVYGPPGSRAMGMGNFGALTKFYSKPSERTGTSLLLSFGNDNYVSLPETDVDQLADYYNKLPSMEAKQQFVLGPMAMYSEFLKVAKRLQLSVIATKYDNKQQELPFEPRQGDLFEKTADVDRNKVKSSELSVLLKRAYAKYPQAQNDVEALLLYDLDQQKNTEQNFGRQDRTNQRQDDVMRQLSDLTRRQSQQIAALDAENDDLSDELDRIEREIPAMTAQVAAQSADAAQPAPASADRDAAKKERETAQAQRRTDKEKIKKDKDTEQNKTADKPAKKSTKSQQRKKAVVRPKRTSAEVDAQKASDEWAKQQAKDAADAAAAAKEKEKAQRDADRAKAKQDREERAAQAQSKKAMAATVKSLAAPRPTPVKNLAPQVPDVIGQDYQDDESDTGSIPWTVQRQAADAVRRASQPPAQATAENRYQDKKIAGRYDPDEFDQLVTRVRDRAQAQERKHGPVDIAKLAQRLRDIEDSQGQNKK